MSQSDADDFIILQPYVLKELGIIKNRCILQVDYANLSCVPYRLTKKGCTVLVILNGREQEHIRHEKYSKVSFHLGLKDEGYDKPLSLFFRSKIRKFHDFNLKHNQCLISLDFLSCPGDYNRLIDRYCARRKSLREKYANLHYVNQKFGYDHLASLPLDKYVSVQARQNEKLRGRIIDFSINRMTLAMDIDPERLSGESPFTLELPIPEGVIPLGFSLLNYVPSKEIPGLFLIQLQLECSPSYIGIISPLFREPSGS